MWPCVYDVSETGNTLANCQLLFANCSLKHVTIILMPDPPDFLGARNYSGFADRYSAAVPTKPHNALYERPAMLSLLPDVRGRRVLDAGCGPGLYAEWLAQQGASVVAV